MGRLELRGLASQLLDDGRERLGVDAALRKVDENRERLSVQARLQQARNVEEHCAEAGEAASECAGAARAAEEWGDAPSSVSSFVWSGAGGCRCMRGANQVHDGFC